MTMMMTTPTNDHETTRRIVSDLDANFIVEAGAGTGKTYALVSRVVALVKSGVPMPQIVAITFTEAAAAELAERIRSRMEQLLDADHPANAADLLPAATMGFAALAFDPNVDNWRAELQDYPIADIIEPYGFDADFINLWTSEFGSAPELDGDSTLADGLDVVLEVVDDFTGIHPEEELLDYLDGDLIAAVQPFDFGEIESNPEENAIDAVAMLSYLPDNKSDLEDTIEDIIDLIAEFLFLNIDDARLDVGADDHARVFAIDDTAYSPGYLLHDGYLTLGSTPDALQAVIQARRGERETLSSNAEYTRAASRLLARPQFVAYADINGIVTQIDRADLGISRDEYRALEKSLSAVAMSAEYGGAHNRFNLVLTLFPDK